MRLILLLLSLTMASESWLSPRVEHLDAHLLRAEALLTEAHAHHGTLAAAQLQFAEGGCADQRCPAQRGVALVRVMRREGRDARDLIQAARAEIDRAARLARREAVAPLVDAEREDRLTAQQRDVDALSRRWLARSAWHRQYVEPWERRHARLLRDGQGEP